MFPKYNNILERNEEASVEVNEASKKPVTKLASELQKVVASLQKELANWKKADGDAKLKAQAKMKDLTATKRAISAELDAAIEDLDSDAELDVDENLSEAVDMKKMFKEAKGKTHEKFINAAEDLIEVLYRDNDNDFEDVVAFLCAEVKKIPSNDE